MGGEAHSVAEIGPLRCRIMFDSNAGSQEHGYWLWFDRSKSELAAIGEDLQPGLVVTIYMIDELEMEAALRRAPGPLGGEEIWWADPIAGTVRYLDGSDG